TEWLARWHIDLPLFIGLALCITLGLLVLYSASNQSVPALTRQASRVGLGVLGMLIIAQIPPHWFRIVAAPAYLMGLLLLALVLVLGDISEGAQRWLDIGPLTFQPSEIMKIAVPLIVAAWFHHRPIPPRPPDLLVIAGTVLIPVVLVALQPDM